MEIYSSDPSAVTELGNDRREKWNWFVPAPFKATCPGLLPLLGLWVLPELKGPFYVCREEGEKRCGKRERGNEA